MKQFEEAVAWIESLGKFGIKPGLERMQWVLEKLGHPERRLKFIHIAGTNGKGSTLQYVASVLRKSGFNVGTYISPALGGLTNRIQYNGNDIPEQDFVSLVDELKKYAPELAQTEWGSLTEFEVTTLLAILYFAKVSFPDLVVWETGLGGRLDCTNVVIPLVSVITNVGYDHVQILGDSIEKIAFEKAGIIKNGIPVITAAEDVEAIRVIEQVASSKKSPVYRLYRDFDCKRLVGNMDQRENEESFSFSSPFRNYDELKIPLLGEHQVKNAAVAVMTLNILREYYAVYFEDSDLIQGLREVQWPGRFEIKQNDPHLILDGAHNIEGIKALVQTFQERFPNKKATLLFSALMDKDIEGMISLLSPICEEVIVTKIDHERAAKPQDLEIWFRDNQISQVTNILDWKDAFQTWINNKMPNDILLATGSLYFISDIYKVLGKAQASCSDLQGKG